MSDQTTGTRPAYGVPKTFCMYDEDNNPFETSVGWDISWNCCFGFGFDANDQDNPTGDDPDSLHFWVSNDGAHVRRAVTREQVRDFAVQLIELAGRGREVQS